jgi:hypothetical protein
MGFHPRAMKGSPLASQTTRSRSQRDLAKQQKKEEKRRKKAAPGDGQSRSGSAAARERQGRP